MSTMTSLESDARVFIPEINSTDALSGDDLASFLNYAAREFLRRVGGFPTSTDFATVVDTMKYLLSVNVPTFAAIRKEGVWWKDTNDKWHQLDSETDVSLSRKFPFWQGSASGRTMRYFIQGNDLWVHPPPESSVAASLRMYHYARSVDVVSGSSNYIFTNSATVEYVHLVNFEEILFDYVRYRVYKMLGNREASAQNALTLFYRRCIEAKGEIAYRPDLAREYKPYRAGYGMQRQRAALSTSPTR